MKVSVLASGSKANSCYIETKETKILVDIGLNCINTEKKLQEINVDPEEIEGIFITHVHKDHAAGLRVFNKKHKAKAYLTEIMYKELNEELTNYEFIGEITKIKDLTITAIKTSHDAEDSNGYIIENNGETVVYITDTGYINIKNHKLLKNKTMYIMESNHDVEMLMNNPNYPYHLKQRILGDKGHLSNKDSAYYLKKFIGENTKYIILAHLSEHNNTEELAKSTLINTIESTNIDIRIARQEEIMEPVEV
jgi:phosphoribosyl 1,2-cyclic phosphodiesterase